MNEKEFKDYYKMLQVHYDASQEVIEAAYAKIKELGSQEYSDEDLTNAYSILSDHNRRTIYHRQWLAYFIEHAQFVQSAPKPYETAPDDKKASAENMISDFFQALYLKDFENAYQRLSSQDKENISLAEFVEWRTEIGKCFEMHEFKVQYVKTLDTVTLDSVTYRQLVEFQVIVTDLNLKNLEITTDTLRKYATFDGDCWKVCLGMKDVRSAIWKYRQMQRSAKPDDQTVLSTAERVDNLTGLLNEAGFFEEAKREVERNRRYNNPFTLLSFQLICDHKDQEMSCVCELADTVRSACRSTDIAARLDNNQVICLLAETDLDNAEAAAMKFMNLLKEKSSEKYKINFGLVFYNGYSSLSDAVLACCHMAGLPSHY